MTSKEAKYILNAYRNRNYNSTLKNDAELAKAIDTVLPKYTELEARDTPMKVDKVYITPLPYHYYYCKSCHVSQGSSEVDRSHKHFCYNCGQRLDWSE